MSASVIAAPRHVRSRNRGETEDSFEVAVMHLARMYGWCGFHIRFSQASTRGVHTYRRDGHMDGWGWPDWVFVKAGQPPKFRELKTDIGRQSPHQKYWERHLRAAGADVGVWRPRDIEWIAAEFSGRLAP